MTLTRAIELSLRTLTLGSVGLVPVVGLFPSLRALRCWLQVRSQFTAGWNPASVYLSLGAILAMLGVLGSVMTVAVICYSVVISYW